MKNLIKSLQSLKNASRNLATISEGEKNYALSSVADALWNNRQVILIANDQDVLGANQNGMSPAMVDRLTLNESRWKGVIDDFRRVIELPDPVGKIFDHKILPNGLEVSRQRVPLGVLAVIYEARPNVTVDVIGLAIKSGNAVLLRGGKETLRTNRAIIDVIDRALAMTSVVPDVVLFIDDPDRELLLQLMKRYDLIDMLIPRGGAGLHKFCRENSMIPVITGGIGICHLFVDETANLEKAFGVIRNAKIQRPTVCNALDTVLIHEKIAGSFVPVLVERLRKDGVSFYAGKPAFQLIDPAVDVYPAGECDFDKEWLSLTLGIKVVKGLDEAIQHIQTHSTGHSDGILTEDRVNAEKFVQQVDSAAVYVNASTRFTDGSALGLGAEIAISTQKLHARGPMALEELTTYKWVIRGNYHSREENPINLL
jgi:glutamate-5-semialdehyde dehydrogenase